MFPKRLKAARKNANLTLEKLAELYNDQFEGVGLNKSTLSKYENGHQKPMGQVISRLAQILNVSTDYLLGKTPWGTPEDKWSTSPDEFEEWKAEEKAIQQMNFTQREWEDLTQKDEKDIAKLLEKTLEELEDAQSALMFSGEPLDEETRELLKASLENSIRIAKINAKQKYTPKKYQKKEVR